MSGDFIKYVFGKATRELKDVGSKVVKEIEDVDIRKEVESGISAIEDSFDSIMKSDFFSSDFKPNFSETTKNPEDKDKGSTMKSSKEFKEPKSGDLKLAISFPGCSRDNIDMSVSESRQLTITPKKECAGDFDKLNFDCSGSFNVKINTRFDLEKISARMDSGILYITVPEKVENTTKVDIK